MLYQHDHSTCCLYDGMQLCPYCSMSIDFNSLRHDKNRIQSPQFERMLPWIMLSTLHDTLAQRHGRTEYRCTCMQQLQIYTKSVPNQSVANHHPLHLKCSPADKKWFTGAPQRGHPASTSPVLDGYKDALAGML